MLMFSYQSSFTQRSLSMEKIKEIITPLIITIAATLVILVTVSSVTAVAALIATLLDK